MTTDNNKQLFQLQSILDTLIEATDHFSTLIKNKELHQSIFIFNSIVEGSQAVITMLNETDERFVQQTKRLENYLVMVVNELEQGNLLKISEIVQFSLRPHFIYLKQRFIDTLGNQQRDDSISIGVFHSWGNPKEFTPEPRLYGMLDEAKRQDALLYFFTSDDVNFDDKTVNAVTFKNDTWTRVTVAFPDVINNIGAGRMSQVERKLRREVPFTSFHVGNKFTLPRLMVKYRTFADLLVPFRVCLDEAGIYDFLENNNRAVFKALASNRGENIYFITKRGQRYILLDQKKERIMNEEAFQQFSEHTILNKKGSYIIQRYIHTRTKADEPYHFRSHVQKDGEGKWQITHIYPRIGNKKSNLSNITTEGRIEDFPAFLQREYGEKQGTKYEEDILRLSIDVAHHLDKLYGLGINELGLDFAIDDTGRIWMHEANNGPQTAYHEEKRAIHFIAYAKYIAQNGIMYTDNATKRAIAKGQFHARTSSLPVASIKHQTAIGLLIKEHTNDSINCILAQTAEKHGVALYSFTPKDIDFELGLVRGSFFENETWTNKIFEYPDAIIDRLMMRGHESTQILYEELADIPFTNESPVYASTRFNLLNSIQKKDEVTNKLTPYQIVDRLYSVIQFINLYGDIRLTANKFSSIYNSITIKRLTENSYYMINNNRIKQHSELSIRHPIQDVIEQDLYIVQQDVNMQLSNGDNAVAKIHLMKNAQNNWSIVSKHAETQSIVDNNNTVEIRNISIDELVKKLIDSDEVASLKREFELVSIDAASSFEKSSTTPITELTIVLAIDPQQQIKILDVNPNSPTNIYDEALFANSVIPYAKSLSLSEVK